MEEIQAPNKINTDKFTLFLAGSINMGSSTDWQKKIVKALYDSDITILNPRRDDFDKTLKQEKDNPAFFQQVNWELNSLDACDLIAMYIDKEGLSPITLLELGIYHNSKKLVVCVEPEYERKGNVDIVCDRYGIPQVKNLNGLIEYIKIKYLEKYKK